MAQSQSDIAQLALRLLGRDPTEQEPSGSEQVAAEEGVLRAHAELAHHGIAYWDIEECPDACAGAMAQYVAGEIAQQFCDESKALKFEAGMTKAMRRMAAVTAKRDFSDGPTRFEDY